MIKKRILQYIEFKGFKKEDFFKKIGITSANFRGKALETPLNSNTIENIFTLFPEISPNWLLTGSGSMLQEDTHIDTTPTLNEDNLHILISTLQSTLVEKDKQIEKLLSIIEQMNNK